MNLENSHPKFDNHCQLSINSYRTLLYRRTSNLSSVTCHVWTPVRHLAVRSTRTQLIWLIITYSLVRYLYIAMVPEDRPSWTDLLCLLLLNTRHSRVYRRIRVGHDFHPSEFWTYISGDRRYFGTINTDGVQKFMVISNRPPSFGNVLKVSDLT